jgi:uncharacterized repeat protein (TIGR03803 family)
VFHRFGANDLYGALPTAGLLQTSSGNFYGPTCAGGGSTIGDCGLLNGFGTVFQMGPNGQMTTLHSFDLSDGSMPNSPLVADAAGNFYGTTWEGGPDNAGTIFRITPDGAFTSLYSFTNGSDTGRGGSGTRPTTLAAQLSRSLIRRQADGMGFGHALTGFDRFIETHHATSGRLAAEFACVMGLRGS